MRVILFSCWLPMAWEPESFLTARFIAEFAERRANLVTWSLGSNAPVLCSCGNDDCWEAFASERAASARYQRLTGASSAPDFGTLIERALARRA